MTGSRSFMYLGLFTVVLLVNSLCFSVYTREPALGDWEIVPCVLYSCDMCRVVACWFREHREGTSS